MIGGLTVSPGLDHDGPSHHQNVMTGFDSLKHEAHKRRHQSGFFVAVRKAYNGRAVWEGVTPAGPHAGLSTCSVPSTRLTAGERRQQPLHEDSIMANTATPTPENRPISRQTALKRLRRHLARIDFTLHCTRPGSPAWRLHGDYVIRDDLGNVHADKISLEARLRAYGLMTDGETMLVDGGDK